MLAAVGNPAATKVHVDGAPRAGRPAHRLDRQDGAAHGLALVDRVRGRPRADRRVVPRERGLVAGRPRSRRARLLVLGAGPAQLGLLEAAAARDDVHVIAVDRDAEAVGIPARRRAGDPLDPRTRRASTGWRARSSVDGDRLARGRLARWDRGPRRGAARPAASDRRRDGVRSRPRSCASASVRRGRRAAAARVEGRDADLVAACRSSSRRPTVRDSAG